MLTKGLILSINRQENTCEVRMPIFETAGNKYKNEATAIVCIPPGIFDGLHVDDVVIVGFENNNSGKPIILGKLYLGVNEESTSIGGAGHFTNIEVTESAILPADTKIAFEADDSKIQNTEVALSSYSSIYNIVSAIKKNSSDILDIKNNKQNTSSKDSSSSYSFEEQKLGTWIDNKILYRKTFGVNFIEKNIGQTKNSAWNYVLDTELQNIQILKIVCEYSFIETTKNPLNAINSQSSPAYDSDKKMIIFDGFSYSINYDNNSINIEGTTDEYTLKIGYFTVEYVRS